MKIASLLLLLLDALVLVGSTAALLPILMALGVANSNVMANWPAYFLWLTLPVVCLAIQIAGWWFWQPGEHLRAFKIGLVPVAWALAAALALTIALK